VSRKPAAINGRHTLAQRISEIQQSIPQTGSAQGSTLAAAARRSCLGTANTAAVPRHQRLRVDERHKLRQFRAAALARRGMIKMINKSPRKSRLVSQASRHKRPSHSPPSYSLQFNTPFPRPDPSRKYSRNCSAAFVPRRETAAPKHQRLRVDERLKLRRLRAAALARRGMMKKDK